MRNNPTMKPGLARPSLDNRVVVFVPRGETALALRQRRRSDNLIARLRSRRLDAQLAAGNTPESARSLAIRAAMLTTPASRARLATYWETLVTMARIPARPFDPHVPLVAAQIRAAEGEISRLVDALHASQPVSARGVAMASELLADGRGPAYNPATSRNLARAVRDARRHLGAVSVSA